MGRAVLFAVFLTFSNFFHSCRSQCPWSPELTALHSACTCSLTSGRQLTVQCSLVSISAVASALSSAGQSNVALLYITNGSESALDRRALASLRVASLQLSQCGLKEIEDDAFEGQENQLESLGCQDNRLDRVPSLSLRNLTVLTHLDLSRNNIKFVHNYAFLGPPLEVLKLSDNQLKLDNDSTIGVENTLRNLALKGTGQTGIPPALRRLKTLAFLDLGQNLIAEIREGDFRGMNSLTALNLERNPLVRLDVGAFDGIQSTLSSLSLLSTLLGELPAENFKNLSELRVLDIGFNRIESISDDAFASMTSLTLLALDGNPLSTINASAFTHLNSTLRGLSIGGRFLNCDCRLGWILQWVEQHDLQVTSRERNPQFCGKPENLRNANFVQLTSSQLQCQNQTKNASVETVTATLSSNVESTTVSEATSVTSATAATSVTTTPTTSTSTMAATTVSNRFRAVQRIRLVSASRSQSTIWITWDSTNTTTEEESNVRVAFRRFGESQFKLSKVLSILSKNFRINNVPRDQCIVVCVVGGRNSSVNFDAVTGNDQCREIRAEKVNAETDKIVIIASSAAICAAVIIAVVIIVFCNRRRSSNEDDNFHQQRNNDFNHAIHEAGLIQMEMDPNLKMREWETGSVYSSKSIPRARMYHANDNAGSINGRHNFRSNSVMDGYLNPRHPFATNNKKMPPYAATFRSLGGGRGLESSQWIAQIQQPLYNHQNNNKLKFTHSGSGHEISQR